MDGAQDAGGGEQHHARHERWREPDVLTAERDQDEDRRGCEDREVGSRQRTEGHRVPREHEETDREQGVAAEGPQVVTSDDDRADHERDGHTERREADHSGRINVTGCVSRSHSCSW